MILAVKALGFVVGGAFALASIAFGALWFVELL